MKTYLSEVLVRVGVKEAPLGGRDLGLEDDALASAHQDWPRAGLIA